MPPLDRPDDSTPPARLLSNGRYTALLTEAGTGRATWQGWLLTAWRGDRVEDADGFFVYLRDLDAGTAWSLGRRPIDVSPDRYGVRHRPGVLGISRADDGVETTLDACVAPDADVELRRVRVRNASAHTRRIDVTTYAEVVLNDPAAHAAHPVFSKLFVETEWVADASALVARRRPRGAGDRVAWVVHALLGGGPVEFETDRVRFIGRGRTAARPLALSSTAPLSGAVGSVLDPVLSLRRTLVLAAGEEAELVFLLGAAETRDAVLALVAHPWAADDVIARAEAAERALLARLGLGEHEAAALDELAGAILYGHPALHAGPDAIRRSRGRSAADLASLGLSSTAPLVVFQTAPEDAAKARAYWHAKGFPIEMVVLGDVLAPSDRDLVHALAAAVVTGPLGDARTPRAPVRFRPAPPEPVPADDGQGGFTSDGSEYVIRLAGARPPMPWVNVIANPTFGCLVSESGAGFTWSRNSREHPLTPWSNDPVVDPHDEALYLRDEEEALFWSALPGPVPSDAVFEVRHGFGASRWRHERRGLAHEVCVFVARDDPVKVLRLRLTNTGERARRLSLFWYARLVPSRTVLTAFDADAAIVLAENPLGGDFADGVVFAAPVGSGPVHVTTDRAAFLGPGGSAARPAALADAPTLDGRIGRGMDACVALQVPVVVSPGATVECAFLLGEAGEEAAARALVARYRAPGALDEALAAVRAFWGEIRSAVAIETPSPAIDLMVNGWLPYQIMSCRLWGRSAFYQSGGAFGFRDQLQDAAALVYARPDLTRAQLLLHAAHQFVEGDVLHWWHPPAGRGTRTRFSDDLLWLPYIAATYVATTGDGAVLDEPVPFVTARPLAPGEDDAYLLPSPAAETASLYEHCCRAIDRSLTRGAHGLPLMGTGDWNDGMNRVGREGRGESVWVGFFLHTVLGQFIPLAEARGDGAHAGRWREYRTALVGALETAAWDGAWYRRAYYDDGTALGSAASDECRIDALVQAWAVISGAAPRARAEAAMDAVERELIDADAGIVHLLWPPFDRTSHDPGYIKGYVPGIRENGGQYTHAALWVVRAVAELGRRERAVPLLEMLTPVHHTRTAEAVAVYQVEPYVVAADIYGAPPHLGRGGWTWYTGSAAWMFRVALESVLGVTIEGGETLCVRPRIPDAWPGYTVRLRLTDGTRYEVRVRNPDGGAGAVTAVEPGVVVDGAARVPLVHDGGAHDVSVTLGGS